MLLKGVLCLITLVTTTNGRPRNLPICGSDGWTYKDEAHFEFARSFIPNLRPLHYGRCLMNSLYEFVYLRTGGPICGSDGNVYNTHLEFMVAKLKKPDLKQDYYGCEQLRSTTTTTEAVDLTRKDYRRSLEIACANDLKSYNLEELKDRPELEVIHSGPCLLPLIDEELGKFTRTVVDGDDDDDYDDDYDDDDDNDDDDYDDNNDDDYDDDEDDDDDDDEASGLSIPNILRDRASSRDIAATFQFGVRKELDKVVIENRGKQFKNLAHHPRGVEHGLLTSGDAIPGIVILLAYHVTAAHQGKELCGSNGHTFEHVEKFIAAQLHNPELELLHVGPCKNPKKTLRTQKTTCGSDGKTYYNYRDLMIAKMKDPALEMVYGEACPPDFIVKAQSTTDLT